jgi:hypothetical protein
MINGQPLAAGPFPRWLRWLLCSVALPVLGDFAPGAGSALWGERGCGSARPWQAAGPWARGCPGLLPLAPSNRC